MGKFYDRFTGLFSGSDKKNSMATAMYDGIRSLISSQTNNRSGLAANRFQNDFITIDELRALYKNGIANKIVRIKAGYTLKDTISFESEEDEEFYNKNLSRKVKDAVMNMIAYGRGIIVLHGDNFPLNQPLPSTFNSKIAKLSVFSGDIVSSGNIDMNVISDRYYQPVEYIVHGNIIHHSRVVDFTYIKPNHVDAPHFRYGGMSEFQMIRDQVMNVSIIERACSTIIERSSTPYYKIKGLKNEFRAKRESSIIEFFTSVEKARSISGAGLVDAEDDITILNQQLNDLNTVAETSYRALTMTSGIPMALLVGENVKGLNSSGQTEIQAFTNMLESIQQDYELPKINELMTKLKLNHISFKDNQGETALGRMQYEQIAIDNALKLAQMGEPYADYLRDKDVINQDELDQDDDGIFAMKNLGLDIGDD